MRSTTMLFAAAIATAMPVGAQTYTQAPRSVLSAPASPVNNAPAPAVAPAPTASAPDWSTPSAPSPAAMGTAPTQVNAAGGLPGSAPPGGVPVSAPGGAASQAAANSVAPGKPGQPQFDRVNFDVDFGSVSSGQQVRRTVTLNTTGNGNAEFSLYIPNAPGFAITELRVMGQGASVPQGSIAQAPLPGGRKKAASQDSVVRNVAARVSAAPWTVPLGGPTELQVDVLYAPTLDLFNNTAGAKMGVLQGAIRNGSVSGTSASIALRANFVGLKEVNAAALKPRANPIYVVEEATGQQGKLFVDFDVASVSAPIDGRLQQAADVPGIRLYGEDVKLPAGTSGALRADGFTAWHTNGGLVADGLPRTVPVELSWEGGASRTSFDVVPVPASKNFQSPMMTGCGVQMAHALFRYEFNAGNPESTVQLTLRNNDPLRTAYIFVEADVGGERICSANAYIGHGGFTQQKSDYACPRTMEGYLKVLRGPVEYRCQALECAGDSPEQCAAAARSRQEHPELWRR